MPQPCPPRRSDPPKPQGRADASVPLVKLAVARSGDKGNHSNIGVIARDPEYLPWIAEALTPAVIVDWMSHVLDPLHGRVERWYLPGSHSLNFLLENALGGGGIASLRIDPQGKAFAQQLLEIPIAVPQHIADQLANNRSVAVAFDSIFKADLFQGHTVIVTGGGSGIGRCTAHELAALGAQVILVGRKPDKLAAVAAEIAEDGGIAHCSACDIRDEEAVKTLVSQILNDHGQVHGLVNNAGGQYPSPLRVDQSERL